jgi:hypothetical protein
LALRPRISLNFDLGQPQLSTLSTSTGFSSISVTLHSSSVAQSVGSGEFKDAASVCGNCLEAPRATL